MFNSNLHNSNVSTPTSRFLQKGLVLAFAVAGTLTMGSLMPHAEAQSGRFNIQQVGDALTSYGKNTSTENGQTYYSVQCGHSSWKSNVIVSLSSNENVIWLQLNLVQMPSRISTEALSNLLKKNTDLGPVFFSIDGNWLRIASPLPNNDMSEAKLKGYLERLVNLAVDSHPLWDPKTLEATSKINSVMHPASTLAPVFSAIRHPKSSNQQ